MENKDEKLDAMLEVVRANTEAMVALKIAVEQNSQIIERLDRDLRQ